ncbi:MAG: hypothetical protein PF961_16045 [Planctomycetota bacterium]|nr:hypothetical protein [Planctomycetota bacterium]
MKRNIIFAAALVAILATAISLGVLTLPLAERVEYVDLGAGASVEQWECMDLIYRQDFGQDDQLAWVVEDGLVVSPFSLYPVCVQTQNLLD